MLTEVFTGEVNIFSTSKNPHSDAYDSTTTVLPLSLSLSLFRLFAFFLSAPVIVGWRRDVEGWLEGFGWGG